MKFIDADEISVDSIEVSPLNNRKMIPPDNILREIADSIKECGVIEPIILNEKYQIVSGQLRWIGAKMAGLTTIPFRRFSFKDDYEEAKISLIQDWVRQGLTDVDRANFVRLIVDNNISAEQVALTTGISIKTIYSWMHLVKMPKSATYNTQTKEDYDGMNMEHKKRVHKLEKIKQFEDDPVGVIKAVVELPKPDLDQIIKEGKSGLVVDLKQRVDTVVNKEQYEKLSFNVPLSDYKELKQIAIRDRKDMNVLCASYIKECIMKYKS